MSFVYTPTPVALTDITLPNDGDPRTAASVNDPFEKLANGIAAVQQPPGAVAATTSSTIPANTQYVNVGSRAAAITLTIPAGLPIGRRILFSETAGQGNITDRRVFINVSGESVVSKSGSETYWIEAPYDRVILEKIGATTWVATVQPAMSTNSNGIGTYFDQRDRRTFSTRPLIIGRGNSGYADGSEPANVEYEPPTNDDYVFVTYKGVRTNPLTLPQRVPYLIDTSFLDTLVQGSSIQYGRTITAVRFRLFVAGTHSALPLMPKIRFRRYWTQYDVIEDTKTGGSLVVDPSATTSAYDALHVIQYDCTQNNRILPGYNWILEFFGEGGANSVDGLTIREIEYDFGPLV